MLICLYFTYCKFWEQKLGHLQLPFCQKIKDSNNDDRLMVLKILFGYKREKIKLNAAKLR